VLGLKRSANIIPVLMRLSVMCLCLCIILQLREFLHRNYHRLGNVKLIMYCYQLSCAMAYLDSKNFVHR